MAKDKYGLDTSEVELDTSGVEEKEVQVEVGPVLFVAQAWFSVLRHAAQDFQPGLLGSHAIPHQLNGGETT